MMHRINVTNKTIKGFKYISLLASFFILISCQKEKQQKYGPSSTIDFANVTIKEIESFVPSIFPDSSIQYLNLDPGSEHKIKSISKAVVKDSLIYILDFKQNSLLFFHKSGKLLKILSASALNLSKIHDFQINNNNLIILDAKSDFLRVFSLDPTPKIIETIKPDYEISTFYNLPNGDFLAYTSPWNKKDYDQILLTDRHFKPKKSYFKREIKEDENYILSSNYIYPYQGGLYYASPAFNKLVYFDKSGNIKMIYNFEFNEDINPKYLGDLQKFKKELNTIKFVNGYCFVTDSIILGDIAHGLNTPAAFYYVKSDNTIYMEKNKYSTILSNKVGSTENGLITMIYPGQYEIIKDSPLIPKNVKEHLKSGQYAISFITLD
ncbi:hypothetical protein D3C71_1200140 [compost metagenome]